MAGGEANSGNHPWNEFQWERFIRRQESEGLEEQERLFEDPDLLEDEQIAGGGDSMVEREVVELEETVGVVLDSLLDGSIEESELFSFSDNREFGIAVELQQEIDGLVGMSLDLETAPGEDIQEYCNYAIVKYLTASECVAYGEPGLPLAYYKRALSGMGDVIGLLVEYREAFESSKFEYFRALNRVFRFRNRIVDGMQQVRGLDPSKG